MAKGESYDRKLIKTGGVKNLNKNITNIVEQLFFGIEETEKSKEMHDENYIDRKFDSALGDINFTDWR